ncbi:related to QRI7-similarity to H.influenzae sialoglycoprotease (gcp) [Phialocephala subalpina]|uniref:N(6)-L-threonylcarbamoyladenine synthase n=1 Tax=Phialocephala subalpina TaxID=576137 RepID=A0A1L7XVQ1_9HELO|nr:related to QRI7-similarity to H.influenzae sialoglycoprotease (gcp) [Phialocephala subalpina]
MRSICRLTRNFSTTSSLRNKWPSQRLLTLAIETSCDDTSVAILEKTNNAAILHFNEKITSDNRSYGGVHPLVAVESHQRNLATLVNRALRSLPKDNGQLEDHRENLRIGTSSKKKPDFVTVTRGPGIRGSLITGLDMAKGLAVAWQVPLLGVNHMQAHALTPRLVNALAVGTEINGLNQKPKDGDSLLQSRIEPSQPQFPFLSLLVSGGHTMLVHSRSLCEHKIIANTTDIAVGDMIDKCARVILPPAYLDTAKDVMYGKLLEGFVFPNKPSTYDYTPPSSFTRTRTPADPAHDWVINAPYSNPGDGGSIAYADSFTYSGIDSSVRRVIEKRPQMGDEERRMLGKAAMEVAFEHLASRVLFALDRPDIKDINTLVVSGGVASNQYLKEILRRNLDVKGQGPEKVELVFPPPKYCTDNAAMIAWTGMEMYEAGWRTKLDALVERRWPIDPRAEGGGILGLDGWEKVET